MRHSSIQQMLSLTAAQLDEYDRVGAVTVDAGLTRAELARAEAAFDRLCAFNDLGVPAGQYSPDHRYRVGGGGTAYTQPLLDVLQHPNLEQVAKQVLRAGDVHFFQTAATASYPEPLSAAGKNATRPHFHIDTQMSLADFEATPRRTVGMMWLWLTDVTPTRAPLMFHPGSHRTIATTWDAQLRPLLPRVQGVAAQDSLLSHLVPHLQPATPVLAKAGQMTILTTGLLHSASPNHDPSGVRKVFLTTFTAAGVTMGGPPNQLEGKVTFDSWLLPRLRPERRHLIPTAKGTETDTAKAAVGSWPSKL